MLGQTVIPSSRKKNLESRSKGMPTVDQVQKNRVLHCTDEYLQFTSWAIVSFERESIVLEDLDFWEGAAEKQIQNQ